MPELISRDGTVSLLYDAGEEEPNCLSASLSAEKYLSLHFRPSPLNRAWTRLVEAEISRERAMVGDDLTDWFMRSRGYVFSNDLNLTDSDDDLDSPLRMRIYLRRSEYRTHDDLRYEWADADRKHVRVYVESNRDRYAGAWRSGRFYLPLGDSSFGVGSPPFPTHFGVAVRAVTLLPERLSVRDGQMELIDGLTRAQERADDDLLRALDENWESFASPDPFLAFQSDIFSYDPESARLDECGDPSLVVEHTDGHLLRVAFVPPLDWKEPRRAKGK